MAEVVEMPRRPVRRRSSPFDHPGNDVGERMRVLQVTIIFDWHDPNHKVRQRGDKPYPREDIPKHSSWRIALSQEFVSRERRAQVVHSVARFLWNQLNVEDWPGEQRRIEVVRRPGA